VRYWAVVGLHQMCTDAASIERAAKALVPMLKDDSPSVPVAAAEALCDWGRVDVGLPVLLHALKDGAVEQARLFAAHAFERLGPKVQTAEPEVRQVLQKSGGDVKKVLERAVQNMRA